MAPWRYVLTCGLLTGVVGSSPRVWCSEVEQGPLRATNLRCEYRVDPLGIDVEKPRLSWVLRSPARGQKQTAYRVLVAQSDAKLAANQGDLWDSGKVQSDRTIHIEYGGKPLSSRMRCYWKVQVWDKDGRASPWSEPAVWSMGLLKKSDWQAKWIADAKASQRTIVTPHNGYHSQIAHSADTTKSVAVDLGKPQRIDAVRLCPARPYDWRPDTPGFLFPLRLKIEAAEKADFSDAKTIVDRTSEDIPKPGTEAPYFRFQPTTARFVRLTANRLRVRDANNFAMALAEMEVLWGDKNLAVGAEVTCLDSIEVGGWSADRLVDGRVKSTPSGGSGRLPGSMLRKEFNVAGDVRRAVIRVTARGLYELRINGTRVGDHILAPEWTDYKKRIQVQTYDVTELLQRGANAIGVLLGDGWYSGRVGLAPPPRRCLYGLYPQLLLQLEIETLDGPRRVICTDATWRSTDEGPIRHSDILDGEVYDARREMPGWDRPGFDQNGWKPVVAFPLDDVKLVWQRNEPIRVVKELKPVRLTEPKPGAYVFDLGQNMVGWCRLKLRGPGGTKVTLRHAERLNDDGTPYTANLRGAAQTDVYFLRGEGEEVFEPHFTYHGFRYVEVTGLPERPEKDDLLGRVFHSASPDVGQFACSNRLVNQLMQNIVWVQRGNMHSTPTDCPQRDERLGWMGDIQAFSQTAIFNMDMAGFFSKWVRDIRDAQADDGRFADFAPQPFDPNRGFSGAPAWADGGIVVPWRMYQNYADQRLLAEHFEAATRWIDYVHKNNPELLWLNRRHNDYGDWLNGDTLRLEGYPKGISALPKEVLATAFFAHSTEIVAKMADVLKRPKEAAKYARLSEGIRAAFRREFVTPDGRIRGDTQAGYALALRLNLLEESLRPNAVGHLLQAIQRYRGHPSTGIQTTHRMMLELTRNGHHHEACRLINLRTVPSWGYTIEMGATTIWERWDGYVAGRGFQDPGMNSFNHWAFGSVGEWIWRHLAGINPDEQQPGFRHFIVRPRPGPGFTWARGSYDSIRGTIASDWRIEGERFTLNVQVPPGTTATVCVPAGDPATIRESGKPADQAPGVRLVGAEQGGAVYRVDSGGYRFAAPYATPQQ